MALDIRLGSRSCATEGDEVGLLWRPGMSRGSVGRDDSPCRRHIVVGAHACGFRLSILHRLTTQRRIRGIHAYTAWMTDMPDEEAQHELDLAAERFSIMSARSHVGAAGFAQSQALETIISAGREQIALTQSLRQVVSATQAQLRDIAIRYDAQIAQVHTSTLDGVVRSGRAQIEAADLLRRTIQSTLTDVRGTPLEEISVAVLAALGTVVQRQAQALEDLIAVAISEATSAEQITRLERVSAEAALRVESVNHERTERELVYLEHLRQQAMARIRQLEADGQTHAEQKAQLEQDAERSQRSIQALEAAEARDLAQIAGLESREQASAVRLNALQASAVRNRELIEELGGVPEDPEPAIDDGRQDG